MKTFIVRVWVDLRVTAPSKEEALNQAKDSPIQIKGHRGAQALEVYDVQVSGEAWEREAPGQPATPPSSVACDVCNGTKGVSTMTDGTHNVNLCDDCRSFTVVLFQIHRSLELAVSETRQAKTGRRTAFSQTLEPTNLPKETKG